MSTNGLAISLSEQRVEINRLMREKYGWADAFIALMFGREEAIPLRLDPR